MVWHFIVATLICAGLELALHGEPSLLPAVAGLMVAVRVVAQDVDRRHAETDERIGDLWEHAGGTDAELDEIHMRLDGDS